MPKTRCQSVYLQVMKVQESWDILLIVTPLYTSYTPHLKVHFSFPFHSFFPFIFCSNNHLININNAIYSLLKTYPVHRWIHLLTFRCFAKKKKAKRRVDISPEMWSLWMVWLSACARWWQDHGADVTPFFWAKTVPVRPKSQSMNRSSTYESFKWRQAQYQGPSFPKLR